LETGEVGATVSSAFFGIQWQGTVLSTKITGAVVRENMLFIAYSFSSPVALLFFVGLGRLFRRAPRGGFAHVLVVLMVLFFVFAFRYPVTDRYVFFLPFYCLTAVLIGLGSSVILAGRRWVAATVVLLLTLLPVGVYAVGPGLVKQRGVNLGLRREIAYRDEYEFFLQPWKRGYTGPRRFAEEVLSTVEEGALVYADSTPVYTLWYLQGVEGKRGDVELASSHVFNEPPLTPERLEEALDERAVYVLARERGYCPAFILDEYALEPTGIVWRVKRKAEADGDK
jgi:hypothetical protein